jgi:spore maturation protein CgeB
LSNRLYDALACGTTVVSDAARGLHDVFGDLVHTYNARDELPEVLARACEPVSDEIRAQRRSFVVGAHTPVHRVDTILRVIPDVARPR